MSHCSIASVKEPLHPLTLPDRTFPYFPAAPGLRANRFLRDSTQGTPRKGLEGALLHGGAFATGVLAGNERPARREQDRHLAVLRGLDPVAPVRLGAVERGIGGNAVRDRAAVKSGGYVAGSPGSGTNRSSIGIGFAMKCCSHMYWTRACRVGRFASTP
jgi:hypothetical protein